MVEAVETGAQTVEDVFSYVFQFDDEASMSEVKELLELFFGDGPGEPLTIGFPTYH